jgi:GNAT superfamily N-acetyltransferase
MMGQGLAQALAGAGAAVKNYMERKEQKAFKEQTVSNLSNFLKQNPDASKELGFNIDPSDKKQVEAAVKGFGGGDFNKGSALANQLVQQFGAQKSQQAALQNALDKGGDIRGLARGLLGAGAGVGPTSAMVNAIAEAEQVPVAKDTSTPMMKEYEVARGQGYGGTLLDYVKEVNAAKGAATRPVRTPEEELKVNEMTMRNKAAFDSNESIIEAGGAARDNLRKIKQIASLFDQGLKTGFGAEFLLKTKQLGQRLGIEGLDTANAEQAQVLFGDFVMSRVQETKGAISNKEMELFAQFSPNLLKTTEGNRQIIAFIKEAEERAQDLSKKVRSWRDSGDSETVIRAKIEDYQDDNPLSFGDKKVGNSLNKNGATQTSSLSKEEQAELDQLRKRFGR